MLMLESGFTTKPALKLVDFSGLRLEMPSAAAPAELAGKMPVSDDTLTLMPE